MAVIDGSPSRAKKLRRGSGAYLQFLEHASPTGPRSLRELLLSPRQLFQRMFIGNGSKDFTDRFKRLQANFAQPIHVYDFFAGKGTDATTWHWAEILAREQNIHVHQVVHVSANDNDPVCAKVLANHSCVHGLGFKTFNHVFPGCITAFMDHKARQVIADIMPKDEVGETTDKEVFDRLTILKDYLYAYAEEIFGQEESPNLAFCCKCQDFCPFWHNDAASDRDRLNFCDVIDIADSGSECPPDTQPPNYNDSCSEDKCESSDDGDPMVITFVGASTPCKDFATYGGQKRLSGPTAVPFYSFCSLMRSKKPKMWKHEITAVGTKDLMQAELGDLYQIQSVVFDTIRGGRPMKRPRRITIGVIKEPGARLHGNLDQFIECYRTTLELSGDVFLIHEEERKQEMGAMAKRAKNFHSASQALTLPWEYYSSAGVMSNFRDHEAALEANCGTDGTFIFDVEHTPEFCLGSAVLPTLITHGTVISHKAGLIFTSSEHMLAMGETIVPDDSGLPQDFPCFISTGLQGLSRGDVIKLAGNAVSTDVSLATTLWLLGNVTIDAPELPFQCAGSTAAASSSDAPSSVGPASSTGASAGIAKRRSHEEFVNSLPEVLSNAGAMGE